MKDRIYLDNNATTPIDPRVLKSVVTALEEDIGNPSSIHALGKASRARLSKARAVIAEYFGVRSNEIIFTANGTESINMGIRGICAGKTGHIMTSNVEHSAVFSTVKDMESNGWQVSYLSAGLRGGITPEAVQEALRSDTRLIVLMAANNETGVKNDIESIAKIAQEARIPFIIDAVSLFGKELFDIPEGASMVCFSGHKIHAPKGIGFAIVRTSLKLKPFITGGDQEFSRRAGTENVPGAVGLAEAIRILDAEQPTAIERMKQLRDRFEGELIARLPHVRVNGTGPRVSNVTNLSFGNVDGEALLTTLDMAGMAVSHGSACASGALEPSRILLSMGIPMVQARSSLRFSLSRFTTVEEIDRAIEIVCNAVQRLMK